MLKQKNCVAAADTTAGLLRLKILLASARANAPATVFCTFARGAAKLFGW